MTRGRRTKDRNESERRCIVTRELHPRTGLIRFVVGPENEVVPDISGRLPGRGMWVSADAGTITKAAKKGFFSRAARQAVSVESDLAERVDALQARYVVDLVAMARKAGQAITGREKTLAALVSGDASILMQACDGSERERMRLRPPEGPDSHVSCLNGHELGMAFGRDRVIHAAVLAGGLADRIKEHALKLSGLRGVISSMPKSDGAGEGLAEEGLRGKG